jgi:hypothetical protein
METKFKICDKAVYLNTANGKFETVEIKGIRIVPTGISKDESGNNVLDDYVILYEPFDGPILAESELFPDKESAKEEWIKRING